MAKRRRRRKIKKSALDYVSMPHLDLDPDTKRGIWIIIILLIGVLSLLGLFNLAGSFGVFMAKGLAFLFGWGKWLIPIILLTLGFLMYNKERYSVRGINYLGTFLFLVSFEAFLHFFIPVKQWKKAVELGDGGGYFGMLLANIFNSILGFWGGLIVLICLLLISLMLMFDVSLSKLIGEESVMARIFYPIKAIFNRLFNRETRDNEDYEEEIDEDDEEFTEEIIEKSEPQPIVGAEGFVQKQVNEEPEFMQEKTPTKAKQEKAETTWKASKVKINLSMDLLKAHLGKPTSGDIKNNTLVIQRTLENFGISVEMNEVSVGPTVTQFTFKPAEGIKVSRITALNNDLALALAAHPIRIEAPIPGKSLVGIEVPNKSKAIVGLREILESSEFKTRKSNLMIALGKDVSGKSWLYDISKMPHLLVAGATNSGKSVCLNAIILSLLYQNNPDDLKFIMVDPKRVELPVYNGIPHLLTPVITDVQKTINALKWCLNEMDRRFETLAKSGKRNIQSYNEQTKNPDEKMPYLVFIIDELADLMVVAAKDIETSVIRLAQMARAVGIHLVLATQRPSVDVITGLIKANMPARIAFSVASSIDSKTILDTQGAEKLLGQGDMLLSTAEISKPKRIQGAFVSDDEIKDIVDSIKEKGGEAQYIEGITDKQRVKGMGGVGLGDDSGGGGDYDDLFEEAKEIIVNMGKASASLLQRRLSVGYARAARIMDELEEAGIIGPANGSKPRDIQISKEQYEAQAALPSAGASLHNRDETVAPEEYLDNEENSLGEINSSATILKQIPEINDDEDEDEENNIEISHNSPEEEKEEEELDVKTSDDSSDNEDEQEEEIDNDSPKEMEKEDKKKKEDKEISQAPSDEDEDEMFFAR